MALIVQQSDTTQQVADINLGLAALQNVIRAHRESLASLQSERDADEARYEALKAERDRMSDELDAIGERLREGAGRRGNLVERLDELLQEKVRLESQRDAVPTAPASNTLSLVSSTPGAEVLPPAAADSQSFEADFDISRTTTFAIQRPALPSDDGFDIDMNVPATDVPATKVAAASLPTRAADVEIDMDEPPISIAASTTPAIDDDTIDDTADAQVAHREAVAPTTRKAPPPASAQRRAAPPPAATARAAGNAPPPASMGKSPSPAQTTNKTQAPKSNISAVQTMLAQSTAGDSAAPKHAPLRMAPSVSAKQMRSSQPRVPLCIDVDMRSENNLYVGFSENISEGGLFIATYTPRPIGERMTVEFTLPNSKAAIRCDVEVVWHLEPRDVMAHDKDRVPGMGMRFVNLTEEDRTALNAFIAKREPMFFPG